MPITWKNVTGGSSAGVASLLEGAQKGVAAAGKSITDVIGNQQKLQEENQVALVGRAENDFRDAMRQQFSTPEALQAGIQSGAVDQLSQQFGNLDRGIARDAPTNRLNDLREQETAQFNYDNVLAERAEAPDVQNALNLASQGNIDGAMQIVGDKSFRDPAALTARINAAHGQFKNRQRDQGLSTARASMASLIENRNNKVNTNKAALQQYVRNQAENGITELSITEDGQLDTSRITDPQKLAQVEGNINELGLNPAANNTALANNFKEQLFKIPGLSLEDQSNLTDGFRNILTKGAQLQPEDQARKDSEVANIDAREAEELGLYNQQLQKEEGSNFWLQGVSQDPGEAINAIMEEASDPESTQYWRLDRINREEIMKKSTELMATGIKVDGHEGRIPVTPALIRAAFHATKDNKGTASDMETVIKDIMGTPEMLKQYTDSVTSIQDAYIARNNISAGYNAERLQVESRYYNDSGINRPVISKLKDRLKNEKNTLTQLQKVKIEKEIEKAEKEEKRIKAADAALEKIKQRAETINGVIDNVFGGSDNSPETRRRRGNNTGARLRQEVVNPVIDPVNNFTGNVTDSFKAALLANGANGAIRVRNLLDNLGSFASNAPYDPDAKQ